MVFWRELKRRKVFQVAVGYAIVAWLLVQVIVAIEAPLNLPGWMDTFVIVCLAIGFPVAIVLSWAFDVTDAGIVRERGDGRVIEYSLIGLLGLAVLWFLFRNVVPDALEPAEMPAAVAAVAAVDAGNALPNSIAVLLCDNLSPDPDNEYFAASLHEEILNQLVKLRNLNVIARTSVLQYSGVARPITEIARELKVESIMECSVAYADGRVAITAQLIDAGSGVHLWSERYNRQFADIFDIQADIGTNIAHALNMQLSDAERAGLERVPTTSPEAYGLYLQAEALAATESTEGVRQFYLLIDRALRLDPDFARAHARKAFTLATTVVDTTSGAPDSAAMSRADRETEARRSAERALAIDPDVGLANAALATLDFYAWRWTDSLASYRLAADKTPGEIVVLQWYAWLAAYVGNIDEGLQIAEGGLLLNPDTGLAYQLLGMVQAYGREFDAAVASLERAQEILPTSPLVSNWLAYVEIARGNEPAALAHLEFTRELLGGEALVAFLPEFMYAYSRLGRMEEVERLYRDLDAVAADRELGAGTFAMASIARGRWDEAIEWLARAAEKARRHEIDDGFYALMNLKMNFTNDPLLEEPRFVEALAAIRGE
jgi:TolB-like protein/Flp pilus assembly protein TadD